MTLIFGNLVQSFVRFGIILSEVKSGSTTAQEQLPAAAAAFRHDAAKDAAILVYIGESGTASDAEYLLIACRCWRVCLYFRLHGNLGKQRGGFLEATSRKLSPGRPASRHRILR